jgi:hypothetical protein
MEKLNLTHIINASNRVDNPHVALGAIHMNFELKLIFICKARAPRLTPLPAGVEYLTVPIEDSHEASEELQQVIGNLPDLRAHVASSASRPSSCSTCRQLKISF